jgi:hypothetical protein
MGHEGMSIDSSRNRSQVIVFILAPAMFAMSILGLAGVLERNGDNKAASFYLFNVYMLFLTLLSFIAECKDDWSVTTRIRPWVMEQFGYLESNLGRGMYLVFIGIIWFGAWGWWIGVVGFISIGVGLLYIAVHWGGSRNQEPAAGGVPGHQQLQEDDLDQIA